MTAATKLVAYGGRVLIVGFGSVGQGVLPLILRHLDIRPDQILVLAGDEVATTVAAACNVSHRTLRLTGRNYRTLLEPLLTSGDLLLNLSFGVSSLALMALCRERGVLYLDTSSELWSNESDMSDCDLLATNYAMRERALALGKGSGPTAVVSHGANPGLVSHLVKAALANLARDYCLADSEPTTRRGWASLAHSLGIKVIQIVERDTQQANPPKRLDEFVNTWSIESFVREMRQPAELGWGSHENCFPADGARHEFGCRAAIYLARCGVDSLVRTWTHAGGATEGFLISHSESISIADFLTLGSRERPTYRPTVFFAYRPCEDARRSIQELKRWNWRLHAERRVIREDVVAGSDELGVLLLGDARGYWYGVDLSIDEARRLAPYNNATTLQVAAAVLAAAVWTIRNPESGVMDPDEIPYRELLMPYLPYFGKTSATYTDWTPTSCQGSDIADVCQFTSFRIA